MKRIVASGILSIVIFHLCCGLPSSLRLRYLSWVWFKYLFCSFLFLPTYLLLHFPHLSTTALNLCCLLSVFLLLWGRQLVLAPTFCLNSYCPHWVNTFWGWNAEASLAVERESWTAKAECQSHWQNPSYYSYIHWLWWLLMSDFCSPQKDCYKSCLQWLHEAFCTK